MEPEDHAIRTRSRSRSNTPFLRSSCDHEHCSEASHNHEKKKSPKVPRVQTIIEESHRSESPIQQSTTTKIHKQTARVITSDYSSDDGGGTMIQNSEIKTKSNRVSPPAPISQRNFVTSSSAYTGRSVESVAGTSSAALLASEAASQEGGSSNTSRYSTTKRTTTTTTSYFDNEGNRNEEGGGISTTLKNIINNFKESSQNELNNLFEMKKLQTSTPVTIGGGGGGGKRISSRTVTSSSMEDNVSNGSFNLSDHVAFKEYKDAGEYWNKYPKTDYTYSKLSPHRREVAPGIVAMPNMSRKSLEHHSDRVNQMAYNNPEQEMYIRSRYQQSNLRKENYFDSQDELDALELDQLKRYSQFSTLHRYENRTIINRFLSWIYILFSSFIKIFRNSDTTTQQYYYARLDSQRIGSTSNQGFFFKMLSYLAAPLLYIFRHIYLFISSILYFDTWFMQSKYAENGTKKRFLLLLLLLLPLLLLGGCYYYIDKPFPITIPPSITIDDLIDPIVIDNIKRNIYANIDAMKLFSEDTFNYLKEISGNFAYDMKLLSNKYF